MCVLLCGPEALAMPDYICEELDDAGIEYSLHTDMDEVIPKLDILYMTRVQKSVLMNPNTRI